VEWISQKTEGFSGADMAILFRDATMQPIRRYQRAKYFKIVQTTP
jgi:SpoVK/Ycf46/Vps4 family AAA+-type ATPase